MAAKNYVVAIELGSTKITGIAGQRKSDGTITDIKVVREDASQCIRKGVVYNIDKTAQCIQSIISRLNAQLRARVRSAYVGVGGQSIHSEINTVVEDLESNTIVTQEKVASIDDKNHSMEYADMQILDVAVQGYRADSIPQKDPAGVCCSRLEGNFLNVLQAKRHIKNVNLCFEKAGVEIQEIVPAPLALADAVITPDEKRSGCVLVDLGASTTTVVVYSKDVLRQVAVIPLGCNNITKDICELQVDEVEAEQIKLKYASAYTPVEEVDSNAKYAISGERTVSAPQLIEIVEARVNEIITNVWNFVPEEYKDNQLRGGVILTGGGSNMKGIELAFRKYTKVEKVRVAKFCNVNVVAANNSDIKKDGTMNTFLGILAKGVLNCCMPVEEPKSQDIFAQEAHSTGETVRVASPASQPESVAQPGVAPQPGVYAQPQSAGSTPVQTVQPQPQPQPQQPQAPEPVIEEPEVKEEPAKPKKKGFGAKIFEWLLSTTEAD